MEAMVDPMKTGMRRLKVFATWTPEPRSRTDSRTRPGARSPSPPIWTLEPRNRTKSRSRPGAESWEPTPPRSRSKSPAVCRKVFSDEAFNTAEERSRRHSRDDILYTEGVSHGKAQGNS